MLVQLELIQVELGLVATGRLAFLLRVNRFPFDLLRWSWADAMGGAPPESGAESREIHNSTRQAATRD